MKYVRERGQRYTMINPRSMKNNQGGVDIVQALQVHFEPISLSNQTGQMDSNRTAIEYVDRCIGAGTMVNGENESYAEYRDKKINEFEERIDVFVQNHIHYTREGGLGKIWPEKTQAEKVADLELSIKASEDRLREMKKELKPGTQDTDIEQTVDDLTKELAKNKPTPQELVKPVGVTAGTATSRNARSGR